MAKSFVRASKFRHVFGEPAKAELTFTVREVNDGTTDGHICAVNPKFIAIATKPQGGGAFLVVKIDEVGRISTEHPQVRGHKGKVLDLAWNPFNDNIIASGDDAAAVNIWNIPEEGLSEEKELKSMVTLDYHQKKIVKLLWHPTAENIFLTSAHDGMVVIWNLESVAPVVEIRLPDSPFGLSWDYNGSRLAVTCKDKKIRIYDSHTGALKKEWDGHEGSKPQMVAFTKYGLFSTGFDKMSARHYTLWDEKTGEPLEQVELDQSNGVNVITYDWDTSMIYLAAKGDSVIRYYEITSEAPYIYWLSLFMKNPQTFAASMPKRGCDVNQNEVMRFYRIEKVSKGNQKDFTVTPTAMKVPRKSELFQHDLFPDTAGDEAALTADQWEAGETKEPIHISLEAGYKAKSKEVRVGKTVNKVAGLKRATPSGAASALSGGVEVSSAELKALKDEIKTLKATVESQAAQIAENTSKMSALEEIVKNLEAKME